MPATANHGYGAVAIVHVAGTVQPQLYPFAGHPRSHGPNRTEQARDFTGIRAVAVVLAAR
jgi:hypothetical protein